MWRDNRFIVLNILVLLLYLYPLLYSFFTDIHKKDKEIMKILEKDDTEEIIQELQVFEYYTFRRFVAEVLKQFSSMLIFIYVQMLFVDIPELVTENSKAMMHAYISIIIISLAMCLISFIFGATFSIAIVGTSITKRNHIRYIINNYKK